MCVCVCVCVSLSLSLSLSLPLSQNDSASRWAAIRVLSPGLFLYWENLSNFCVVCEVCPIPRHAESRPFTWQRSCCSNTHRCSRRHHLSCAWLTAVFWEGAFTSQRRDRGVAEMVKSSEIVFCFSSVNICTLWLAV